jgi:hypothetical protein
MQMDPALLAKIFLESHLFFKVTFGDPGRQQFGGRRLKAKVSAKDARRRGDKSEEKERGREKERERGREERERERERKRGKRERGREERERERERVREREERERERESCYVTRSHTLLSPYSGQTKVLICARM